MSEIRQAPERGGLLTELIFFLIITHTMTLLFMVLRKSPLTGSWDFFDEPSDRRRGASGRRRHVVRWRRCGVYLFGLIVEFMSMGGGQSGYTPGGVARRGHHSPAHAWGVRVKNLIASRPIQLQAIAHPGPATPPNGEHVPAA